MTPSAWLSFSTDLVYLASVLSLLAVIAFKLSPIRAVRYWWVRRERDRIAAMHRRMDAERRQRSGTAIAAVQLIEREWRRRISRDLTDCFNEAINSGLNRAELEGLSSAMDKAERRIIH